MFYMLTAFNLREETTLEDFESALRTMSAQLSEEGLLESTGPIGRRHRHPVMDTDMRDFEVLFPDDVSRPGTM